MTSSAVFTSGTLKDTPNSWISSRWRAISDCNSVSLLWSTAMNFSLIAASNDSISCFSISVPPSPIPRYLSATVFFSNNKANSSSFSTSFIIAYWGIIFMSSAILNASLSFSALLSALTSSMLIPIFISSLSASLISAYHLVALLVTGCLYL